MRLLANDSQQVSTIASRFRGLAIHRSGIVMGLLLLLVSAVTLGPLLTVLLRSLQVKIPASGGIAYGLNNWARVLNEANLVTALGNSAVIAVALFFLSTGFAVFFSWLVARTDTPFRGAIEFALWMGYFLPLSSQALGWMLLLDPSYGLINQVLAKLPFVGEPLNIYSYAGIVWVHLPFSTAARFILITPAFRRMDPALEEAARVSGNSNIKTLLTVTIPILAPSILASAFLGFIKSLESFDVELLLGMPAGIYVYSTKVYQIMTESRREIDFEGAAALSSIFLLVVFLLFFLYLRVLSDREFVTVTGRGYTPRVTNLGRWRWVALAFCVLFVLVTIVVPAVVIVLGTFMKLFGFFNLPEAYTLEHWQTAVQDNLFMMSLRNSALLAVGASVGGMFSFALISYVVVKTNFIGRRALDFVSWLPWTLPSILLGLGLSWVFLSNPILRVLYGTLYGLILAMIVKEMPMGIQMTKAGLMQISKELEEACLAAGASWASTFRNIIVPILLPSMLSVAMLVFISSMRDVGLVVLLASHQSRPLSLLMIDFIWGADYGKASVIGVILVIIIICLALLSKTVQRRFEVR